MALLVRWYEQPIRIRYAGTRIITPLPRRIAIPPLSLAVRSCAHPWSWLRPDHPPCTVTCAADRRLLCHRRPLYRPSFDPLRRSPPPSPCPSTPSFPPLEILHHPRPAVGRVAVWRDFLVRGAGFPVASSCCGQVEAEDWSRRCLWRMSCVGGGGWV